MSELEIRTLSVVVAPKGEAIFSELATTIAINDDAGGEYLVITQGFFGDDCKIKIGKEEWPTLREAIDKMIAECRD